MPYKVFKDGSQYCVHKLKDDGSKGAKVKGGCHAKKSDADKHQRALEVNVKANATGSRVVTFEPIPETDGVLSVVHNVDICAVGIEYPLASGPQTFTPEDLQQAVASQDDPAVQAPRVWLGHPDDQRFHAGRTTPVGSAEPALGTVINMRIEDNGMTLVGDIAGCPTWLASILASAYPNRSIEGYVNADTVTNHKWSLIVTDLALLGVKWPGVSNLDDLQALYSVDGPSGIEVEEVEHMAVAAGRAVTAQINVDDVRRAFYSKIGDMDISAWSWIRAMQLDPNELIVDDDEGSLYRVGFEIKGEEITFTDPTEVKIQYVNASQAKDPAARGLLVNLFTEGKVLAARWETRAESRPNNDTQEDTMGTSPEVIQALRERLGLSEEQLPDDASDEQVAQAIQTAPQPSSASPPEGGPTPSPDQVPDPNVPGPGNTTSEPAPGPATPPTQASAAAPGLPEGYVAVPVEAWQQVQSNAAAGAAVAQQTEEQRRGGIIASAIKEGRISPAQRASFSKMFEKDPQGTETLLTASVEKGGLMKGTIPIQARGSDPSVDDLQPQEAYPASWLPEVQATDGNITQEVA